MGLIQIYKKGQPPNQKTQVIFANKLAQCYFLNADKFLLLINKCREGNGETEFLRVKKYTKDREKRGYINGEVLARVSIRESRKKAGRKLYQFEFIFGPSGQKLTDKDKVLDKHKYLISVNMADCCFNMLSYEQKYKDKICKYYQDADAELGAEYSIEC